MEILRDKHGKPEGIFREIAGAHERLYDRAGRPISIGQLYSRSEPSAAGQGIPDLQD